MVLNVSRLLVYMVIGVILTFFNLDVSSNDNNDNNNKLIVVFVFFLDTIFVNFVQGLFFPLLTPLGKFFGLFFIRHKKE